MSDDKNMGGFLFLLNILCWYRIENRGRLCESGIRKNMGNYGGFY